MEKQHHIDAKELFQRFLQGNLNKSEEALLRKEAEADPFLAEAIAGIDGGGAEDHHANLKDLRKQLALKKEVKKRTIFPWRAIGAVAAVGLLLIIGSRLWQNNTTNVAMGDQLEKEMQATIENDADLKSNSSNYQFHSESKSAELGRTEDDAESEIQEVKKKAKYNYQTGANEVKPREQEPKISNPVNDGVAIENKNRTKANTVEVNKPAPLAVEANKDKENNSNHDFAVIEEAAEDINDIPVESNSEIVMEAAQQRKPQALASNKESLDDNQDSAYYTDSGLLIETEFDKNDSSFIYTGNVFDTEGAPLIGANVLVEGTDYATTTDFNGGFVLASPKRLPTLEVFYLGYEPTRIRPSRNDDNLSIFLAADNASMDEVVTTTSSNKKQSQARTSPALKSLAYQPKGGFAKWEKYVKKNLKKPKEAKSNSVAGNVVLSFTINDSGLVSDIEILQSLGYGCDEEAIRLLKEGPKWVTINQNVENLGRVSIKF